MNFNLFKQALPFIKAFRNRIFVVKFSGELCDNQTVLEGLAEQLAILHYLGIKLVVVHGGGRHASELAAKLGVESKFVAGRRVTSAEMLEVVKMSFAGKLNSDVLAVFSHHELPAVGLSGIDTGLFEVKKRGPVRVKTEEHDGVVDFGYVADICSVDAGIIRHLLDGEYVPVICSLAADKDGQILNVNADTIASVLAAELQAVKLCLLSSVDGVLEKLEDPTTLFSVLNCTEVERLLKTKRATGGMRPKLETAIHAIRAGVPKAHILSGTRPNALLQEIFTNEGSGTMILPSREENVDPSLENEVAVG